MSIPKTMKAMLLTGHGGPGKLVFENHWPTPDIAPDEVLIRVGACGINNTDIWVREGAYGDSDDPDAVAPNLTVLGLQVLRKQMVHHMRPIKRRNRDEIEERQNQVDIQPERSRLVQNADHTSKGSRR